jgi:HlyD family secretion protein
MATRKTQFIVGGVALALLVGIVVGSVVRDRSRRTVVQTGKVGRRDLSSTVSASGEVKPKRYVDIGANPSGRIVKLFVKEGDTVKKGQVLARIEAERYEAGARQSEAAVLAAQADLERSIADVAVSRLIYDRNKRMFDEKLVSDQTFDQTAADLKMKTASVESSRKRVAQLQAAHDSNRDELAKTTVLCPMDGVVTSLPKEEGEVVIGAQSFSPTVIMTVADLSVMEAEVMVDETDIRSVKLGQVAEVRADALEGVKMKGEVTEIGTSAVVRGQTAAQTSSNAGNTGNQAKDFKVKITLKDPPREIRPGLNATADITTAKRQNVLALPIQAVVVRELNKEGKVVDPDATPPPQEGNTVTQTGKVRVEEKEGVFILDKDKAAFRPIKTGIVGETDVEVLDGLKEGEEIVTGSFKTLRGLKDQAKIKVETKKERP